MASQSEALHRTSWRGEDWFRYRRGVRSSPDLSVLDNLTIGATRIAGLGEAEIAESLEREFTRFPVLRERRSIPGGSLSGGEQQMLALSRALMMRPKALMLDEPSLGLAPQIVKSILQIFAYSCQ